LRKRPAAVIGPIVCELDGPMPGLNRSKTLTFMTDRHPLSGYNRFRRI
jgi:hypothetical protein